MADSLLALPEKCHFPAEDKLSIVHKENRDRSLSWKSTIDKSMENA